MRRKNAAHKFFEKLSIQLRICDLCKLTIKGKKFLELYSQVLDAVKYHALKI